MMTLISRTDCGTRSDAKTARGLQVASAKARWQFQAQQLTLENVIVRRSTETRHAGDYT